MMRTADHDVSLFARYRQQWDERNLPLQYGHGERQNLRSCPVARPDRQLASRESESESNGTATRRRIAVACSRCRKRKIKCSGDPGNGMGCQNCRSAGADSCNFYRVGSSEISLLPSQPLGGHVIGYSATPNLGMFHVYQQPPHSYPCYQRPYSQGSSLSISTRSLPPSDWTPIHSDCDSPVDGYPLQSAAIMTGPQPYGPFYNPQMSRSWTSLSERSATGINNYVEKEHSTHSVPFMNAVIGPRQAVPTEDASSFNVSGLQTPLPRSSASKRQLPIPSPAGRQIATQLHTDVSQIHSANATPQTGREANVALYSAGSWATENYSTDCRENSVSCGASINQSGVTPTTTTASNAHASARETSPRRCAEPISSPVASPTTIRTSRTMSATSAMTTLMDDATPAPTSASPVVAQASTLSYVGNYGSQSSEHMVHRNCSVSDLLTYQFGADKPNFHGEMPSEADTLANGQRYEPIAQSQPDRATNVRDRRESWRSRAVLARRASVTERNY